MSDDYDNSFYVSSQVAPQRDEHSKTLNDPIWGYNITLEPMLVKIVDTPHFQRLRDLKQLGVTYHVFPGASHNRFEHSIGTSHLAGVMIQNIMLRQPNLNITPRDMLLVKMAGLCHDMGHGPFSHVFDNEFLPRAAAALKKEINWKHEDASEMMLEAAIKDAGLDDETVFFGDALKADEIQLVKEMINPDRYPTKLLSGDRQFMYEIVSNSRCSIDTDKFDYLLRDSACTGVPNAFNPRRLMRNCRVINGRICFDEKDCYTVHNLFMQRYSMFKQVYSHAVGKAIELMVCDIMLEAEPVYRFTDKLHDPDSYLALTDSILRAIAYSTDPRLEKARALCTRLFRRQLYPIAGERVIYKELDRVRNVTNEDIIACAPAGSRLRAADILVQNMKLNFAMKDKNPMDYVSFYNNKRPNEEVSLRSESVSMLTPSVFQERYIRVFVRCTRDDTDLVEDARAALIAYVSEKHKQNDCDLRTLSQVEPLRSSQAPHTPRKALSRAPTLQMGDNSDVMLSERAQQLTATPTLPAPAPASAPSGDSAVSRVRSVCFDSDIEIEADFDVAPSMSQRPSQPSLSQDEGRKKQKTRQTQLSQFLKKK